MPNRLAKSRMFRVGSGVTSRHRAARVILTASLFGVFAIGLAGLMFAPMAQSAAGINKQISFQGKVVNANGTNVANGSYSFVFNIYTQQAPGGSSIWTESKTLTVTDGIFQTNLGSVTSLPGSVDFNTDNIFLGINFNSDGEMDPRIQFTAVPYSFNAGTLDGIDSAGFAQINPSSAQSGSLNVTGTVQAATSLQAPLVDTATAVALEIGKTTATSVTLGRAAAPYTIQGNGASIFTATDSGFTTTVGFTTPTANNSISFPNAGGTICTTVAATCNGTYMAAGSYLAKNATDTSSAAVTAANYLYGFTNSSSAVASGVLRLDNGNNTGNGLLVTASGNPGASQALLVANNTAGSPSGNLLDLQKAGTGVFTVDYNGSLSQSGGSSTTQTINGQRISSAANFTGTVTAATSLLAPLLDTASAGTLALGTTSATAINLNKPTTVASGQAFTANGSALFQPNADTTSAFNIKTSTGNNQLTVDTVNGRLGVSLSGSNVPTLQGQGIEVNGALRLSGGGGSSYADLFLTPVGSNVGTKINIPLYDPGNFGQLVAMGLPSGSSTTARALSLFDARTVSHQPTIGVFSPNENNLIGFSWDGSDSVALLKNTASDVAVNANGINVIDFLNNAGSAVITAGPSATLQASSANKLDITANAASAWTTTAGNLRVDSAAALQLGTTAATSLTIGHTGVTTQIDGTSTLIGNVNIGTAGSTLLTNNGATKNTTCAYTGVSGATTLNTAAKTPDVCTSFTLTTSGTATVTVPAPSAGAGSLVYVTNMPASTNSLTLLGTTLGIGATATLVYSGSAWTYAGADGNGILNQNAADQTADFRISGTGRANTSFVAPAFDSVNGGAGTLSLGATNANAVTVGNTAGATSVRLQGGTGGVLFGSGAGQGFVQNNGATVNTTLALGDLAAGSIGANTATVDIYTSFSIAPTVSGRTYTIPTPTTSAAYGRIIYISNIAAAGNSFIIGGATINPGATATLVWANTNGAASWQFAGADAGNLQTGYNNSLAGTTPQILANSTKLGVTIQNANTGGLAAGAEIFGVRSAVAGDALTSAPKLLTVTSYGVGVNLGTVAAAAGMDLQFGGTANRVIQVQTQATAATAGANLTVRAATGNTTGAGGILALNGGTGGATGLGGAVQVTGGTAGGGNTAGGAVTVAGGTPTGSGTGGATAIRGGDGIATAGSTGGALNIRGGNGTTTGVGAAGGVVTINGGNAGGTNNNAAGTVTITGGTSSSNAAAVGGVVAIQGGAAAAVAGAAGGGVTINGANGTATGTGGVGGNVTITAGNGTGTGADRNGGSIQFTAGTATGNGVPGVVQIDTPVFTNVNQTFTQTGNGQAFPAAGAETTTLQANVDGFSTLTINVGGAFTGSTVTIPNPRNTATGRIIYVAVANGSVTFTLAASGMKSILMAQNSTAMLVWNGFAWTGSAAATSLQDVYNNTSGSPAGIVTTSVTKNLLFQAGVGFDNANLFQVGNSNAAPVIAVDTTNTATGANLASNSGIETGGTPPTSWSTVGTVASLTQNTTAANLASGVGSLDINLAAAGGAANTLNATLAVSSVYNVSFNIKTSGTAPTLVVEYYRDATTFDATCSTPTNGTINSTKFFKYTCTFTTTATAKSAPNQLRIRQSDTGTRHLYIDNVSVTLQNTTGAQNTGVLQVGGPLSQGLTLFTVDSFAGTPFTGSGNTALLGSMFYDTTIGRIQCYESDGWGACGAAQDNNIIMTPEYASAVLSPGDNLTTNHVGAMTAGMCSGSSRLTINTTVCAGANEDYNYYRWTSGPNATLQTFSIYVKYQLPVTFKNFADNNTITVTGRSSNLTDASVKFVLMGGDPSALTYCAAGGASDPTQTTVTSVVNTWQSTPLTANETTCGGSPAGVNGFNAGQVITFRIDMSARNNAYAYVSNIQFTVKGK